jgi:hypothetical protein
MEVDMSENTQSSQSDLPGFAPKVSSELKVEIKDVDPELAQKILNESPHNRKRSKTTVDRYALEMSEGRWWENGVPIIMNGNQLLDGGHRLAAILQSGVTLRMIFVYGIDLRANRTMDIGKLRSLAQMLELEGKTAPVQLSQAINWLIGYVKRSRLGDNRQFTVLDKFDLLYEHPKLEDVAMRYDKLVPGKSLLNQGMYACAHYLFQQRAPEETILFMEQVITGENLKNGDPAHTYREGVMRVAADDNAKRTAALRAKCANALVFAWNKFRAKEQWPKFKLIDATPEIQ